MDILERNYYIEVEKEIMRFAEEARFRSKRLMEYGGARDRAKSILFRARELFDDLNSDEAHQYYAEEIVRFKMDLQANARIGTDAQRAPEFVLEAYKEYAAEYITIFIRDYVRTPSFRRKSLRSVDSLFASGDSIVEANEQERTRKLYSQGSGPNMYMRESSGFRRSPGPSRDLADLRTSVDSFWSPPSRFRNSASFSDSDDEDLI